MPKKILMQCRTPVNRDAVKRKTIDGVEHIIISSATLPDDIVMNGGLYPAEEIQSSFMSLERTPAPVEHPVDSQGNFISANDPTAIHNFYAGAFNENVRRENGRVMVDKVVNVQQAKMTDRGKRLLDRVEELETNDNARPIHTSVGVFLEVEDLDEPQTNAAGQEFTWIARQMVFDHDAILLDSVGAAQPHQGVGMAVNRDGDECEVTTFEINTVRAARRLPLADSDTKWDKSAADKRVREKIGAQDTPNATFGRYHLWFDADKADSFGAYKLPFVDIIDGEAKAVPAALRNAAARLDQTQGPSADEKETIRGIIDGYLDRVKTNGLLHSQLHDMLNEAIKVRPLMGEWVADFSDEEVIFISGEEFFSAPYIVEDDRARIVGIPIPVERDVSFNPKTNQKGDAMRELMINALAKAGITVNAEITDAELMAKYNEHLASQDTDDGGGSAGDGAELADVVANALKPLSDKLDGLEAKINSQDDAELDRLAEIVGNSDKFPGLDVDAAKKIDLESLKKMAANAVPAHGVPLHVVNNSSSGDVESYEMPA